MASYGLRGCRTDEAVPHWNTENKGADTMEKIIETNCLADIISEAGKGTNIPYLRGGERLIREVLTGSKKI